MWKLIKSSAKLTANLRYSVLNNNFACQYRNFQYSKISFNNAFKKSVDNSTKKSNFKIPTCTKIAIALTSGGILQVTVISNKVLCNAQHTRMTTYKKFSEKEQKFDWNRFWHYLKPHLWYFIAAIVGALAVAILNIQIPQIMGGVINVISRYTESKNTESFISEMKVPAIKLVAMYVSQSLCTFFYIYMLSNLGEKISFQMRTDLFASILKQDIAFFDEQRTGEIINRLTTDIHDFKSSFKQTVSGGLRAAAQIIGCSISLVLISPHMTFVTLLCVPTVIAVGTVFGAVLRTTSRKAQAQVEKTTAVADEAVSNIRTVRAFAMEDQEQELFDTEAELAMILNENLGFGIGWFQAGTNMFLNGMVLITLYMGGYLLSTDKLSPGQLMAYLMASQTIQRSLGQLSLLFGSVVRGVASGSRIFEYMNLQPTVSLKGGKTISEFDLKGEIEFENVTFAYPSRRQQVI
jgi:ATP-binding cassette subfamily B (MDR/TAP) protein 8